MGAVGWLDTDLVAAEWYEAPDDAEGELTRLLRAAHEVCEAYAPALPEGSVVPERYAKAQLMQAKHIWARQKAGNAEGIGPDGYAVSTFPLVLEARSLLRPKRGNPFKGVL